MSPAWRRVERVTPQQPRLQPAQQIDPTAHLVMPPPEGTRYRFFGSNVTWVWQSNRWHEEWPIGRAPTWRTR